MADDIPQREPSGSLFYCPCEKRYFRYNKGVKIYYV